MTTPPALPLTKSLVVPDAFRRRLLRITADGRARVVYGVTDANQPVPHVGVVLAGRQLVAWLTECGWEDHHIETEGALWSEVLQAVVPTSAEDNPLRHLRQGGGTLAVLCIRRVYRGAFDRDGFPTDVHRLLCQRRVCEEMTHAVGMVEIVKPDWSAEDWRSVGVLVPDDHGEWSCMDLRSAEYRARAELRVPIAPDSFPAGTKLAAVETPAGPGTLVLRIASNGMVLRPNPDLRALSEITLTFETVNGVTLEARRGLRDFTWSVHLYGGPGRPSGFRHYPAVVEGANAMHMVLEIARTFVLPDPAPADAEATPAAQRAYVEHMAALWNHGRRLQFVLDALGIADTVQPYQITPREAA